MLVVAIVGDVILTSTGLVICRCSSYVQSSEISRARTPWKCFWARDILVFGNRGIAVLNTVRVATVAFASLLLRALILVSLAVITDILAISTTCPLGLIPVDAIINRHDKKHSDEFVTSETVIIIMTRIVSCRRRW